VKRLEGEWSALRQDHGRSSTELDRLRTGLEQKSRRVETLERQLADMLSVKTESEARASQSEAALAEARRQLERLQSESSLETKVLLEKIHSLTAENLQSVEEQESLQNQVCF